MSDPSPAPGRLTVLAGPTAVGKGTIVAELRRRHPGLFVSVSATTRAPRPGEIDGVHYHFVDEAAFDRMVERGQMLEWALVHGRHRYGTPRGPVQAELDAGRPALVEIDLDGARQVRRSMPGARLIFVAPPSWWPGSRAAARRTRGSGPGAWPPPASSWGPPGSSTTSSSMTPCRAPRTNWRG